MARKTERPTDDMGPSQAGIREIFAKLRRIILSITMEAGAREATADARRLLATLARSTRKGRLQEKLDGMQAVSDLRDGVLATWVDASEIEAGRGGAFDACDLRHYLALARRAGVPAIPAVQILALSEDEMAIASGTVELPKGRAMDAVRAGARSVLAGLTDAERATLARNADETEAIDREAVEEKLMAAMDEVPEGWMVRHVRCGPATLKSLAGTGLAHPVDLATPFGSDFEMGPGWVRLGNRRMVDARDRRIIESLVHGRDDQAGAFVARPWIRAGRWEVGEDPHRHGSPFASKGCWPCEWRAFVEDGKVVGVANYYGWNGAASPMTARIAIEVRRLAQLVADEAVRQGAFPQILDHEMHRASNARDREPRLGPILDRWAPDKVGFTLDFLEGPDGLVLLEGGPAHTELGGGHCCAFAGAAGQPIMGRPIFTQGVAFRIMDHVSMGDMKTWHDGDRTGRILPWAEVEALAARRLPPSQGDER